MTAVARHPRCLPCPRPDSDPSARRLPLELSCLFNQSRKAFGPIRTVLRQQPVNGRAHSNRQPLGLVIPLTPLTTCGPNADRVMSAPAMSFQPFLGLGRLQPFPFPWPGQPPSAISSNSKYRIENGQVHNPIGRSELRGVVIQNTES